MGHALPHAQLLRSCLSKKGTQMIFVYLLDDGREAEVGVWSALHGLPRAPMHIAYFGVTSTKSNWSGRVLVAPFERQPPAAQQPSSSPPLASSVLPTSGAALLALLNSLPEHIVKEGVDLWKAQHERPPTAAMGPSSQVPPPPGPPLPGHDSQLLHPAAPPPPAPPASGA